MGGLSGPAGVEADHTFWTLPPKKMRDPPALKSKSPKKNSQKLAKSPKPSTSHKKSTHLRFDSDQEDEVEPIVCLDEEKGFEAEDNSREGRLPNSDGCMSSASDQSDNDDAPEVLSTVASKRHVIEKEKARQNFQKAAAAAKKQANQARDQKLKQSKSQAKLRSAKPDPSSSSSSDAENEAEPKAFLPDSSSANKKYLDPSLFVTAAKVLEKSRMDAEALEDTRKAYKKKRKRSQRLDEQDRRELGPNTFVVRLPKPNHLVPSTRPESASKFVINRLSHIKSRGSPLSLSKATRTAKTELGSRKRSSLSINGSRKTNRPAAVFARQSNRS